MAALKKFGRHSFQELFPLKQLFQSTQNLNTAAWRASETVVTEKLVIKCQEDPLNAPHPYCPHGPTLFFYYEEEGEESGYFACSAHRNKSQCGFHLPVDALTTKSLSKRYETQAQFYRTIRQKFVNGATENHQHYYCVDCNVPLLSAQPEHHAGHEVARSLSPQWLQDPTQFLRPLNDDKVHAQYFFDNKALQFFAKCFEDLGINKVICMGAPRLHAYLRAHCLQIQSFLLDFDHRFFYFFEDNHFAWYNMCNNYFFDETQELQFKSFLNCDDSERILIFTDPPFGCRTEPIAHTLRQLTELYNHINELPHQPVPIFWIFPYFSERYIQQQMPHLEMCDYKVNYTNHTSYTDISEKGRKQGSPVRVFTNVPLERLHLPVAEGYKYCMMCRCYTALENRHCDKCGVCPAKNGDTYRHCNRCGVCVKPSYVHCGNCRRCTQVEGHICKEYQAKQRCWICLEVGHTEHQCVAWKNCCKKIILPSRENGKEQTITCLICGAGGHNERKCKQRSKYIEESTFLGETQLKFRVKAN